MLVNGGSQRNRVLPCGCAGKHPLDLGEDVTAGFDGQEVDILRQPSVGQVRAGERGAAEEHQLVGQRGAEGGGQVRDQVVAAHLFERDAEPFGDVRGFVVVEHVSPGPLQCAVAGGA